MTKDIAYKLVEGDVLSISENAIDWETASEQKPKKETVVKGDLKPFIEFEN